MGEQNGSMARSAWSYSKEILLLTGINLSKNPGGAGDSPMLPSPKDFLAYLFSAIKQKSGFYQQW